MPRARNAAAEQPAVPSSVTINQTLPPPAAPAKEEKREEIDFWSYLRALSPTQWRDHTVYLYRTRPVVGLNQREKYLCVYQQPFSIEDVKKTYGGEEFRAILNRGGSLIKQINFAVEAAPIYDTTRETPRPADANAAMTERLVDKVLSNGGGNPSTAAALDQVVDMMGKGFDAALERIGKSGGDGGGDMMKILLAMMQSQTTILTTLLTSVVKERTAPGAGGDAKSSLKDTLELFSALKEFAADNGSGGRRGSLWETLAERAVDKAPELIREIRGGVETIGRQRLEIERARTGAPAPPGAPAVMPQNAIPLQPSPAAVAAPPAQQPPPPLYPEKQISESEAFEQLSARHIVKLIFDGEPVDVVLTFLRGANRKMYEAVLDLDKPQLLMVIKADPILSQLEQYPELDAVLDEIVQYAIEEKAAAQSERDTEAAHVQ